MPAPEPAVDEIQLDDPAPTIITRRIRIAVLASISSIGILASVSASVARPASPGAVGLHTSGRPGIVANTSPSLSLSVRPGTWTNKIRTVISAPAVDVDDPDASGKPRAVFSRPGNDHLPNLRPQLDQTDGRVIFTTSTSAFATTPNPRRVSGVIIIVVGGGAPPDTCPAGLQAAFRQQLVGVEDRTGLGDDDALLPPPPSP
jgi:hypothetical protein